jgi:3-deoxy-D-manno-octulosonate 8-phosphate phosphatase (KDO 8-P phosphatase)
MTCCAPGWFKQETGPILTPPSRAKKTPAIARFPALTERLKKIKLAIFDVDGVLTDGRLYFTENGHESKVFHSRDGHGMKMLQASGVKIALITGRTSRVVALRAKDLGVPYLYQGAENKLVAFHQLLKKLCLNESAAAYFGDDIVDLPAMCRCGLAVTVPDAPVVVRQHAHYVTLCYGGHGAVRELCEMIMDAQGTLKSLVQGYLK